MREISLSEMTDGNRYILARCAQTSSTPNYRRHPNVDESEADELREIIANLTKQVALLDAVAAMKRATLVKPPEWQ